MKKSLFKAPLLVGLVSLSLLTSYAFAESNKGGNASGNSRDGGRSTATSTVQGENNKQDGEQDGQDNESDVQEQENENSLHEHFAQTPDIKTVVTFPQIDPTKITTYADVVTLLNQYRDVVNQIKNEAGADSASSSLSVQEKAILSKLITKHSFELSRTNVRADEVLSQIKDLIDVLTPLGTQTISSEFNLKNLLILQLNDFASTISSLTDLVDTTSSILDEETN